MTKEFIEIARIPVHHEEGEKYQIEWVNHEIVVRKEQKSPGWKDVTKSCYLDFRYSHHCDGRYIAIIYKDKEEKLAAVVGTQGIVAQNGFRIEKPKGAYTSFKIYKKNG